MAAPTGRHPPPGGKRKRKARKKRKNRTYLLQRLALAAQIGSVLATFIRLFRNLL